MLKKKILVILLLFILILVLKQASAACNENWYCSGWTSCKDDKQVRVCVDLNDCGSAIDKPEIQRDCEPLTIDGGVDDGGDIPVATCFDGVLNQGEQGIDCGGPCVRNCVSTPLFFLWIAIPIVILVFFVLFVLFILRGRKQSYAEIKEKKVESHEDVHTQIKKEKEKGVHETVIQKKLETGGWPKNLVETKLKKQPKLPTGKGDLQCFVKEAVKEGYTIDQIKNQLLHAGWEENEIKSILDKYRKYLILSKGK